jgi:hypothetical protein
LGIVLVVVLVLDVVLMGAVPNQRLPPIALGSARFTGFMKIIWNFADLLALRD